MKMFGLATLVAAGLVVAAATAQATTPITTPTVTPSVADILTGVGHQGRVSGNDTPSEGFPLLQK